MTAELAAMTVGGVLTHTYITDQVHLGESLLDCFESLLNDTMLTVGIASELILHTGDTEEHNLIYAGIQQILRRFGLGMFVKYLQKASSLFSPSITNAG